MQEKAAPAAVKKKFNVRGAVRLAALALVIWGLWRIATSPMLEIDAVEVRGPVEALGLQEVTEAVRASLKGNILTADIEAVRGAVEALPWVKSAQVRRLWPDTLHIDVVRHHAVAIWDDGRLVSDDGRIFASNDEPIERLVEMPAFSGDPQYVPEVVRNLPLFEREAERIGARVKAVKVTFRGSWSVVLESERFSAVTVELGRALAMNGPLVRLGQVVDNFERVCNMMQGYPDKIDARYRNAFAAKLPTDEGRAAWRAARQAASAQEKAPAGGGTS